MFLKPIISRARNYNYEKVEENDNNEPEVSAVTAEMEESARRSTESGLDNTMGRSTDVLVVGEGRKFTQFLAAIFATIGGLSLGTMLGWTSPASVPMRNGTGYDFIVSESEESWVGAFMPLGAAATALPIGVLLDVFGRKRTMLATVIPFTIGWALVIWPSSVGMMYGGRFVLGVAGGSFAVAAPTYTSEIAEASVRGALGSYFQLMITIGICLVYILGAAKASIFAISLTCGIIPLIFGVLFFFMPDTPTWYISKGRFDDARSSLRYFRGSEYRGVEKELEILQKDDEERKRNKISIVEAFQTRAAKIGMVIALSLMLFQQLSGVNAVIFYTSNIFTAANSNLDPAIASLIVGVVQVVATFISTLIVDRLGRKILLLASAFVMCICSLLLGVFFYLQKDGQDVSSIGWLPLLSLCLFITFFSFGFGPIPWMIVAELFLPQTKSIASSIASFFNWVLAFLVTKFFVDLNNAIGTGETFWLFMAILAVGVIFIFFVVKETKGKSFQEIQEELGG